ncbi:YdgA family protein [Pectobacterium brasiliense]|uniref:YdgA family protein n=1 Tax=Pectobacterium brasiliense TaxID=180957 RepID=UPI002A823E82|nr:YdgA family protein [Pectobacterium brasiliense]MDY4367963.1 YdgA family protein [Pectobacterium brasiliense]MDY7057401.1 YdgA family protein [Pectobacterium brasiliense]
MKKSLVAVGVIVALGAVWTGASWYTGKQMAQQIDGFTDTLNTKLKQAYPNAGLKVVYRDYKGGVFSSTLSYVLQADGSIGTAEGAKILAPGEELVFNETVSHGPFPLAQLKKFNLIPAMASVHTELANTPAVKAWFELTKDKPFFTAETRVAYSGDTQSLVTLAPIDHQSPEQKFSFSGAEALVDIRHDLRSSKLDTTISSVKMERKNAWGQTENVDLTDFSIKGTNQKGKFDLDIGDGNLSFKAMTFTVEGGEPVTLNDFSLQSSATEDDKNLAGKLAVTLGSLVIGDRNLGSGNVNMSISQLDGAGTKQFVTAYQEKVQKLLQDPAVMDPDTYQHEVAMSVLQYLPQLLKGNPSIAISPISWKNSKGEGTFTLALDLTDPLQSTDKANDATLSDEEKIIRQSVKKLDAKLNVPLDMLAELMVQAGPKPANDEEQKQATEMAQQQAKMMAGIGQMNQLSVTKDNAITSSLHYADGQIDFNGNKISLADFIAPYFSVPTEEGEESLPGAQEEPVTPPAQ